MRWIVREILTFSLAASLVSLPGHAAQTSPTGIIVDATSAHLGTAAATSGATVYPGDIINTDDGGHATIRIGQTRYELVSNSTAAIFPGAAGATLELRRGSVIISSNDAAEPFRIFASDVLVVPDDIRPLLTQVTINSECSVHVTSQQGKVEATSGHETRTVDGDHAYDVRPEFFVYDSRVPAISPDDPDFHRSHNHKSCPAAPLEHQAAKLATKFPVAAGNSHFTIMAGTVIGIITVITIHKALESPDRP